MNREKKEVVDVIFENFYSNFFQNIYSYTYRLIGNREEAEQLTQHTFTKLYSYLGSNISIRNPKGLIYQIAQNNCFDYLRQKRKVKIEMNKNFFSVSNPNNLDDEIIRRQKMELVRSALEQLPIRDQKCILLYQEGFTYGEISKIAKIKKSSVGKVLSRATERLAQIIKEER